MFHSDISTEIYIEHNYSNKFPNKHKIYDKLLRSISLVKLRN